MNPIFENETPFKFSVRPVTAINEVKMFPVSINFTPTGIEGGVTTPRRIPHGVVP